MKRPNASRTKLSGRSPVKAQNIRSARSDRGNKRWRESETARIQEARQLIDEAKQQRLLLTHDVRSYQAGVGFVAKESVLAWNNILTDERRDAIIAAWTTLHGPEFRNSLDKVNASLAKVERATDDGLAATRRARKELRAATAKRTARFKIEAPPLHRLVIVTSFFCSKRTCERVVGQIVADIRLEHAQAFVAGEAWKARWIIVRGYGSVLAALGFKKLLSFAGKLFGRFGANSGS